MQQLFFPTSIGLRHQLKNAALVVESTPVGSAVKIAGRVEDKPGFWTLPVVKTAEESVQDLGFPRSVAVWRQLEDRALALWPVAGGRAIQVSCPVAQQMSLRIHSYAPDASAQVQQDRLLLRVQAHGEV